MVIVMNIECFIDGKELCWVFVIHGPNNIFHLQRLLDFLSNQIFLVTGNKFIVIK